MRDGFTVLPTKTFLAGEIVGYALDSRMTQELVITSLLMAVRRKRPERAGSSIILIVEASTVHLNTRNSLIVFI